MKKRHYLNSALLFPLAAVLGLTALHVQAEIIYSNGFDNLPVGIVKDKAIKKAWDTRYAKGPDEGRVRIVNDSNTGKAVRVKYPKNTNQSSPSGATWETDISYSGDELYMSYWVKFDEDFQFVKGGKMPGLAGADSFPYGDNGFTTRLMWREDGKLEFYLHGYEVNNSKGAEPYRVFWDDAGYHASLEPGQWHHIEIHQKLNTPGKRNGVLRGWLDGELVCDDKDNSGVRGVGHGSTKLNHLYFSTFFGGSSAPVSQWQPKKDVFANYDDFIVSTKRIGMETSIEDVSSAATPNTSTSGGQGQSSNNANTHCTFIKDGAGKQEINLNKTTCLRFASNLKRKQLSVWDSDKQSCDFKGSLTSINGKGSLNVSSNYDATRAITGTKLSVQAKNGCQFLQVRAK